MLFSPKSYTMRDLNTKLNITWHQWISKIDPNVLKLTCGLKNT